MGVIESVTDISPHDRAHGRSLQWPSLFANRPFSLPPCIAFFFRSELCRRRIDGEDDDDDDNDEDDDDDDDDDDNSVRLDS